MSAHADIIIPTYNGREYLDGCLTALQQQTYRDFQIIVVDDGSTDGTEEHLRDQWPTVKVLALPRNVGLAAAINQALDMSTSEFVALLNNDTEVEPGWLGALIECLERNPETAAVTSKLLLFDKRDHIHSAGDTFSRRGRPGNRGVWQRDSGQYDQEVEVFGACAGAALYRREALNEVAEIDGSVLDPDFFMYCEDVDLSWRLRLRGHHILYVPSAIVYHRLSATGGGTLASYYVARNTICVIVKDLPSQLLWRNCGRILADQTRALLGALPHLRETAARAQIRGTLAALPMIPHMIRKRARIQQHRVAGLDDLSRLLVP